MQWSPSCQHTGCLSIQSMPHILWHSTSGCLFTTIQMDPLHALKGLSSSILILYTHLCPGSSPIKKSACNSNSRVLHTLPSNPLWFKRHILDARSPWRLNFVVVPQCGTCHNSNTLNFEVAASFCFWGKCLHPWWNTNNQNYVIPPSSRPSCYKLPPFSVPKVLLTPVTRHSKPVPSTPPTLPPPNYKIPIFISSPCLTCFTTRIYKLSRHLTRKGRSDDDDTTLALSPK